MWHDTISINSISIFKKLPINFILLYKLSLIYIDSYGKKKDWYHCLYINY